MPRGAGDAGEPDAPAEGAACRVQGNRGKSRQPTESPQEQLVRRREKFCRIPEILIAGNPPMLRLAIAGATGRMGRCLVEAIAQNPALKLGGASVSPDNPALGRDVGEA